MMIKNGVFTAVRTIYTSRCGVDFFSKPPLNYETLSERLRQFYRLYPKEKIGEVVYDDVFIDFIRANRFLQRQNIKVNSKFRLSIMQRNKNAKFLDILTFSNSDLESKIHEMLSTYKNLTYLKDSIVKSYILTEPRPSNTYHLIETVRENFQRNLSIGVLSKSVVQTTLNLLLAKKDYYNCFKLVDVTYRSESYLRFCEEKNLMFTGKLLLSCLVLTFLETIFLPSVSLYGLVLLNFAVPLYLTWYMMKINSVNQLGRISWRPYNNFVYNNKHQNEMLSINKIITHFEEHNEINIKNFHHSKVRQISNLNVFHQNDYIIELPHSSGLIHINDHSISREDSEILKLQAFFRKEIHKRKMVLNDIQEELMFLEFWYSHGEKFEWVEPDQDPAEIIRLKINNGYH